MQPGTFCSGVLLFQYLESGTFVRRSRGFSTCRICGEPNGSKEYTDGTFLWPEGLAHYVHNHSVRLPACVIDHIVQKAAEELDHPIVDEVWWRSITREDISKPRPTISPVSPLLVPPCIGPLTSWTDGLRPLDRTGSNRLGKSWRI